MFNLNSSLQVATLLVLPVLGFLIYLSKTGAAAAVKTSAEEAAKTTTIQQLKWPGELARELQKTRGVERQESRYRSYGKLWKELRPLAIYEVTVFNKEVVEELSSKLSDWYFSETGGLLLTSQARDFYFALQDVLRATSKITEDWVADRPEIPGDEVRIFRDVLKASSADAAISALDYISTGALGDWQNMAADIGRKWRAGIDVVAGRWQDLDNTQRFAALQQVGSILRTSLTNDLESRLF